MLGKINLEQLGVASIIVAILIWQNWELRRDLRDERSYGKKINALYQESTLKALDAMKNLEQAFVLLRDSLK